MTRLEQMRNQRDTEPPPAADPVNTAPRRRRRTGWFGGQRRGTSSGLEQRLAALEDRLMAVERSFVGLPGRAARPRLASSGEQQQDNGGEAARHAGIGDDGLPAPGQSSQGSDDVFGGLPYRLTGSVEDGLMTDVLQMLASNQKSGRFSFFAPGEKKHLDLYFRDGEVIHAKAGDEEGESAFFSIMVKAHDAGKYGFLEGDDPEIKQTIEQKTQFLILEALRRIDEERNSGDGDAE